MRKEPACCLRNHKNVCTSQVHKIRLMFLSSIWGRMLLKWQICPRSTGGMRGHSPFSLLKFFGVQKHSAVFLQLYFSLCSNKKDNFGFLDALVLDIHSLYVLPKTTDRNNHWSIALANNVVFRSQQRRKVSQIFLSWTCCMDLITINKHFFSSVLHLLLNSWSISKEYEYLNIFRFKIHKIFPMRRWFAEMSCCTQPLENMDYFEIGKINSAHSLLLCQKDQQHLSLFRQQTETPKQLLAGFWDFKFNSWNSHGVMLFSHEGSEIYKTIIRYRQYLCFGFTISRFYHHKSSMSFWRQNCL